MNNTSCISILIPLYNSENYIAETIENCLAQTYENIEVIIVDDGSTDNSLQIARKYESKYKKIKVYSQKNAGAPRARNLAFDKSSGEYIQYLDADDLMSGNKIASQMELVEKYGDKHIYSSKFIHFNHTLEDGTYVPKPVDKSYDSGVDWLIASWSGGWFGTVMNWLTPRHLIEKAGPWNEEVVKNQDGEFFCRVLLNSKRVIYDENAEVYYRITGEHSVASQVSQSVVESVFYTYSLYEIHTQEMSNETLKNALAYNYLSFITQYYPKFPLLLKEAEDAIFRLGYDYYSLETFGKLRILSKILGAKNVIRLRYLIQKIMVKK